jgi:hypothetical protein
LASVIAPRGSSLLPGEPAPASSEVTDAGRLNTAQCQKPEPPGASGSWVVTTKLCVCGGNPDQDSCGDRLSPPAPRPYCAAPSGAPSVMSALVSLNCGTVVVMPAA